MPKPDPALLDPARYSFNCQIEPRFGDLDYNLHINNVALLGIVEEARLRFHAAAGHPVLRHDLRPLVASVAVEYLAEGRHPDPLTICAGLVSIGRSSYTLGQLALQCGRAIAHVRTVMVCTDDSGPATIPQDVRDAMQPWLLRA